MKQFILTQIGGGCTVLNLTDTDLWGLRDALYHGIQDGYFEENKEWAETMAEKINELRHGDEEHE